VRVPNAPPYLYLDFRLPLNARQTVAVRVLFENRFERILVEFRREARSFGDWEEALIFLALYRPASSH
jgi:hypothetical protein